MLFTIASCRCGNPVPHLKFFGADGSESNGKFTMPSAMRFIDSKLEEGVITAKHATYLQKGLRSLGSRIGLAEKGPRLREYHKPMIIDFLLGVPEKDRVAYLQDIVSEGSATQEEADSLRDEIKKIESIPLTDQEKERLASACELVSDEEIEELFEELISKGCLTQGDKEAILARAKEFRKIPLSDEDIARMPMDLASMEKGEEVLDRITAQGRISAEQADKIRSEMKNIQANPVFTLALVSI